MQLAGTVGVSAAGALAIAALTRGTRAGLPVFFFAILCGVRSMFHAAAGSSLVYARGERTRRDITRYLGIALAQSFVLILFVDQQGFVGPRGVLALGCALLSWPTVLAIAVARPRLSSVIDDRLPTQSDFGFESMSLLMMFFGACGTAVGVALLVELASSPAGLVLTPVGAGLAFVAGTAIIRSAVHTTSGARGVGGAGYYTANDNAGRYYRYGLASSAAIASGVFVCAALFGSAITAAVIAVGAGTLSWAWPGIVRRYYREQNFSVFMSGHEPILVRPPDGGTTTWGWLRRLARRQRAGHARHRRGNERGEPGHAHRIRGLWGTPRPGQRDRSHPGARDRRNSSNARGILTTCRTPPPPLNTTRASTSS
jgi:hypothetical protein